MSLNPPLYRLNENGVKDYYYLSFKVKDAEIVEDKQLQNVTVMNNLYVELSKQSKSIPRVIAGDNNNIQR